MKTKRFLLNAFLLIIISNHLFALDKILFEENKNQWPAQAKFRSGLGNGITLYMEKNKFTYVKYDPAELEAIHEKSHDKKNKDSTKNGIVNVHAFQMNFVGSNTDVEISAENKASHYNNYFIGNDPSKWASEVGLYSIVKYKNMYPNIDIIAYEQNQNFKYDFVIAVGGDPAKINLEFNGADKLIIKNNKLIIKTSVGDIIENVPYSYQTIDGKQLEVVCEYQLSKDGKTVSFNLPNGYNIKYPLTIDPILVASTYSGSTSTVWGHSAAYDPAGNIYTGGECFDLGYPATVGAFQTTFGGHSDIVISKLNPNGTSLIWATYIGGVGGEIPNSLFIPQNEEIYILGTSFSSDYPVSTGCFDNSFNGSWDLVITHLNSTGTALIGSTYVGGAQDDGINATWYINGHDSQRGEIIVDATGNAWVASYTKSNDFPTSTGAYDQTLSGAGTFDGCAFRLSPNLSALEWSTFIGGTDEEAAYGLRLNSLGELYITGCTGSSNFPSTVGTYDQTFNGGIMDGYVTRFNAAGTTILSSTFYGTTDDDISYFIDMDALGNAYIYGSSNGNMPVTAGVYSNPNSGNFVSKFNPELSALIFSTVFGDGTNTYLEPEAFMVDSCQNIYMSGFGASDYPTTSDALFSTNLVGSCFFFVLSKDALTQLYGSYYYGNHVDGGTSRFSPDGTIYQGICMSGTVPTTPGAWNAGALNTFNFDMFVVKIAFQLSGVNALASIATNDTICLGNTVSFINNSNGVDFYWNFGDGSTVDTSETPTHVYSTAGTYNISFVAIDSASCNIIDSTQLTIVVLPQFQIDLGNDTTICGVQNILLNAGSTANTYTWSTGATSQTITANTVGSYWVTASNGTCETSDTINIQTLNISFSDDTTLCLSAGQGLILNALNSGATYLWSTGDITQTISVVTSGQYWVTISAGSCQLNDTINTTISLYPVVNLGNDTLFCQGNAITLNAENPGASYLWSTNSSAQTININSAGTYWVAANNGTCAASDTINIQTLNIDFPNDTSICLFSGQSLVLNALNSGATYLWSTGDTTQTINVTTSGQYLVAISVGACQVNDTINTMISAYPVVYLGNDTAFCQGNALTLNAGNPGANYLWSTNSTEQTIDITSAATYYVAVTNSCGTVSDSANINYFSCDLHVPNVITPNGEGSLLNELFYLNNLEFYPNTTLVIYNRWGTKLYETTNYQNNWSGSKYSDGVYYYLLAGPKLIEPIAGFFHIMR